MNLKECTKSAFLLLISLGGLMGLNSCSEKSQEQSQTISPTPGQQAMIDRKYGMFLHFGMNTYLNAEWSDGSAPAATYNPPADIAEKAAQWVTNAKKAGMRSIVLTTKHHDGFCLWDSQYTDFDIANPDIRNKADIVKAVSDACRKEGIAFSVYYSLWDRHEPCYKEADFRKYIDYMKNQLKELMTNYGEVCELWFDGAWDKKNVSDWCLPEIYQFVKEMQPNCQISTNWTLGKRPVDMAENDSIIYFPADFRLWDPFLPVKNDPKIYSHGGKKYYLPFECTQTISVLGNWFSHPEDKTVRELDELEEIFYVSTANDNCLLLNIPPDVNGEQNPLAIERITALAQKLGIEDGKPFPKQLPEPKSLTSSATASASSIFKQDTLHYGAMYAIDSDVSTAWKADKETATLEISLKQAADIKEIAIIEERNSIQDFFIEALINQKWATIYTGKALADPKAESFMGYGYNKFTLPQSVQTDRLRINIQKSSGTPSIYSIRLK